jgi:hypothetical protein
VSQPYTMAVFDALMIRALIINDRQKFPDEMRAFDTAFQGRRIRMLITRGILDEYQIEPNKFPPFRQELQPTIDRLNRLGRVIYFDEYDLSRSSNPSNIQLIGLPQEHRSSIYDAVAAQASYFITTRQSWLDLSEQTGSRYGLQIVTSGTFAELEG